MGNGSLSIRDPQERADSFYRFSVKCDRATNARIEAAARKAGMTVTGFVQRHFEAILDAKPNPPMVPAFDAAAFDAIGFSKRHQITLLAARLWGNLRARADVDGLVRRFQTRLAEDLGCDHASTGRLLAQLVDAGMLEIIRTGKSGSPPTYRVIGEG